MTAVISWHFLFAAVVVIVTPGPDIAFLTSILLRSRNRRAAILAASGMMLAGIGHAALGIGGMTLVLYDHPGLFLTLRACGAVILACYGLVILKGLIDQARADPEPAGLPAAGAASAARPVRHPFIAGFGCTAANPKVGLFLVAFLPQFVPHDAATTAALLSLATTYLALGALWLAFWIYLIGRLQDAPALVRIRPATELVMGVVLLFFAARLAMQ
ncbi:MAG TPA: LysE family translocator [Jatrophihabitans sp.]|jgi:threonine/homoserine/homoserine lactone efflux protein|uniref:LysE family translocator n=1 Tax=Jatrophihabitans sp. TaxID=1932789 RepID=UPI002F203B8A